MSSPRSPSPGVVAFGLGFVLLLIAERSFSGIGDVVREPLWLWTGGALSVLIILAITVASPRIGLAATIGIIIAFNLIVAALIDRFGWFGFDQIAITWTRMLGLLFLGARRVALALQEQLTPRARRCRPASRGRA